ncbi:hypothetical protein AX15_005186 [Amanita polypyramis BW_CC]|nr:hypothetical protein AX15_005186 [Amanita polypyramis BW_CC]
MPTAATARLVSLSNAHPQAAPVFLAARRYNNMSSPKVEDTNGRHMLRMITFGKPGSGKGTLTARLVKKYDVTTLSSGDLLRRHINQRTEVGQEAEAIVAAGGFVPDDVMLRVVSSELDGLSGQHWILDGFPRTPGQAELLDVHLKKHSMPLTLIVNLDVPDDVLLSRISDRWVHLPSGRVYNLSYNPPRVPGYDDVTGEPLTKRPDDNPEVFARRLARFYAETAPILDYYANQASIASSPPRNPNLHPHQLSFPLSGPPTIKMRTLAGSTSDEIWPQLDGLIRGGFPALRERADTLEMKEKRRRHSLSEAVFAGELGSNAHVKDESVD